MTERDDEIMKLVDKALAGLSEHFDSIQIIATRHDGDKTIMLDRGTGNWYSRFGAGQLWVRRHLNSEQLGGPRLDEESSD